MNLRHEIFKEFSKQQAERIGLFVGNDERKFSQLMDLFFEEDYRVSQRAAWVVSHCCDKNPVLITPHIVRMVRNLDKEPVVAVKRNTVRVLQRVEIPDEIAGSLTDHCFRYLDSKKEPVAVKVFSMTILANLSMTFPEIKNELRILIEDQMPFGSAGFRARGRKVLKKIGSL